MVDLAIEKFRLPLVRIRDSHKDVLARVNLGVG